MSNQSMTNKTRCTGLLLLALTLTLGGCAFWETRTSDADLQPISTRQLRQLLESEQAGTVLVDVRTAARFSAEHLPGAINIPLAEMRSGDQRLAEARNIVTYSGDFGDYLAPAGAKKLMALGYQNVWDYRGGIAQWKDDGGEVIQGTK